jgi:hypothetical protein
MLVFAPLARLALELEFCASDYLLFGTFHLPYIKKSSLI